jgi:hypothetical protein
MRSTSGRIAIGLATLAVVVALFVVFAGGDDDGGSETTTTQAQTTTQEQTTGTTRTEERERDVAADPQITVRNGRPVGGVEELSYDSGERIKFVVTADVADEVHVHGYDIAKDVRANGTVRFAFPADIEGVFEVELESAHVTIAKLRVGP